MNIGLFYSGNWGPLDNFGRWGWIGLVFSLMIWFGVIASLALLVLWALRWAHVSTTTDHILHRSQQQRKS